ncbi:MAG: [FeFe] hydrogenase H-cluster radical SAM maturase HydE [Bacteroidales bacterium]|nr:[FeFe] hydrogenase H-cluster radical SAM maturase HydE [Bacteroidales bacterium]
MSLDNLEKLLTTRDPVLVEDLFAEACRVRDEVYGRKVFMRGLIEVTSHCKNNCLYCGLRRDMHCTRYRLTKEQILQCCRTGHELGFRTFVMQGGEDAWMTDERVCDIVRSVKREFPDCAVTLSLGERGRESFARLKDAGADRYLLRHETADAAHYAWLHPSEMRFEYRMQCLRDLRELGFQTGCGFMVGSPGQTLETLKKDLQFIAEFRPEMVGIGPFIPASGTPFENEPAGSVELTLRLLAIIRVMHPHVLLPATSALGTLHPQGRERAIRAGANVVMPNLSPQDTRSLYSIYNNKLATGSEAAESAADIRARMKAIGMEVPTERGDFIG